LRDLGLLGNREFGPGCLASGHVRKKVDAERKAAAARFSRKEHGPKRYHFEMGRSPETISDWHLCALPVRWSPPNRDRHMRNLSWPH